MSMNKNDAFKKAQSLFRLKRNRFGFHGLFEGKEYIKKGSYDAIEAGQIRQRYVIVTAMQFAGVNRYVSEAAYLLAANESQVSKKTKEKAHRWIFNRALSHAESLGGLDALKPVQVRP